MSGRRIKWDSEEGRLALLDMITLSPSREGAQENKNINNREPSWSSLSSSSSSSSSSSNLDSSSKKQDDGNDKSDDSSSSSFKGTLAISDSSDSPLDEPEVPNRTTAKVRKTLRTVAARKSTPAATLVTTRKSQAGSSQAPRSARRSRSRVRRVRNADQRKTNIAAKSKKKPESTSSDSSDDVEYPSAAYYRDQENLQDPVVAEPVEHGTGDQVLGTDDSVPDSTHRTTGPATSTTDAVDGEEPQAGPSSSGAWTWTLPQAAHTLIDAEFEAELTLHTLLCDQTNPDTPETSRSRKREDNLNRYLKNLAQSEDKYPENASTEQLTDFSAQAAIEFTALLFMSDEQRDLFQHLKPLFFHFWNEKVTPEEPVSEEEADRIFQEVAKLTIARCRKMASVIGQDIEDLKVARVKLEAFEKKKKELAEKLETHREELENDHVSVPLSAHQLMKMLNPAFAIWKIGQEPNQLHEAVLSESKKRWMMRDLELLKTNRLGDCPYILPGFQSRGAENGDELGHSRNFSSEGPVVKATKLAKLKRLKEMKQDMEWKFKAKYGNDWAKSKGEVAVRYHRRIPYHHGQVEIEAVPAFRLSAARFKEILKDENNKIENWKYEDGATEEISDDVNWEDVAEDMSVLLRKRKTAVDCKLAYKQLVHPSLSNAPWTDEEKERLRVEGEAASKGKGNWERVAENFPGRSAFQCLKQYRTDDVARNKVVWTDELDEKLLYYIRSNGPDLIGACSHLGNPTLTPDDILYRWSRHINPILRKGDFTILEDVLLILHLVKLRMYLIEDWKFVILINYLPWRYETAWRDRAEVLFADFILPWSKEEDQLLLDLAKQMPGKWAKIARQFQSFKNRKNCASRHKRLMEQLGNGPGQFTTLDEYHIKYKIWKKTCYESNHLHDVLEVLEWLVEQTSDEIAEFPGMEPTAPPAEWHLQWMLIKFDRGVVKKSVEDLKSYLQMRGNNGPAPTGATKMFDRRTFKRDDPQSLASALHLRGINLRRPETFVDEPMNEFEHQVWIHYTAFTHTKTPKADKERKNIPSRAVLINLPEVQRIVIKEDFDVSGDEFEYVPLKVGRPRKVVSTSVAPSGSSAPATRTSNRKKRQRQQTASESEPEPGPSSRVLKKGKANVPSKQLKRKRNAKKKAKAQEELSSSTEFESDEAPKPRKTQKSGLAQAPVASIGRVLRSQKGK